MTLTPQEILAAIDKVCPEIPEEFTEDSAMSWYARFKGELKFAHKAHHGATRLVIIPENCDYVIKIPFTGYAIYDDEEDEDFFHSFGFADGGEEYDDIDNWDYCKVESMRYEYAKEEKLSDFFCAEYLIGTIAGHPVYAQEKAVILNNFGEYSSNNTTKSHSKAAEEAYHNFGIDPIWIDDFIAANGECNLARLIEFCTNESIYDLRPCNIGYNYKTNSPIIVDYAGYYDN